MATRNQLPLMRRAAADIDITEALDHYLAESVTAAEGFVDALERAFAHIQRAPATGSPRWAHELHIAGLRSWPCTRYPHVVFYLLLPDRVDVLRVLHGKRDIPAWLNENIESAPSPGADHRRSAK
ncbi:MAG: type II toxin-antitoxin system RelE/ParE family toxin [Rubrivivax sp.]